MKAKIDFVHVPLPVNQTIDATCRQADRERLEGGCGGRVVSVLSSGSEGRGIDPRLFLPTLDVEFLDSVLFLNKV